MELGLTCNVAAADCNVPRSSLNTMSYFLNSDFNWYPSFMTKEAILFQSKLMCFNQLQPNKRRLLPLTTYKVWLPFCSPLVTLTCTSPSTLTWSPVYDLNSLDEGPSLRLRNRCQYTSCESIVTAAPVSNSNVTGFSLTISSTVKGGCYLSLTK